MGLAKNVANILTRGSIVKAQRARIAQYKDRRIERIKARYEAAYWSTARSYLPGFLQSAREDISALPRQEIMRRVRYFEKNSGVLLKILQCLDVNVIGAGITPTPSSGDPVWNKKALDWWNEWVEVSDTTEQSNFYEIQSMAFLAENIDGDSFLQLMTNRSNRPAVGLIEAHRCGTGGNPRAFEDMGFKVVDGVVIDKYRVPTAFIIADDFDLGINSTIPASQLVQLWRRKRAGQYRGISLLHAAILDLHDLDDLQKYEMRAAKDAAAISKIIETPAGGVTPDGDGIGAPIVPLPATDPASRLAFYRQALGGETLVPMPGDKITQFESKRPGAATSGFWDKLDQKIVQAAKISYGALVDYRGNWGGATLRAMLQSDNRTYELETIKQARASQRVWDYVIGWAIQHGEVPANINWRKVRWHPPQRTTVDVGNDSQAMLDELKGATRTYEIIYGEKGEDWQERLEQRAKEEAFLDELAKKYNIPVARIASFAQERLAGIAPDSVTPTNGQPGQNGQQPQNPPQKGQNA